MILWIKNPSVSLRHVMLRESLYGNFYQTLKKLQKLLHWLRNKSFE